MPTTTANLGLTLPTPNVDTGWGSTLNTDFTLIDNLFAAAGTGTSVGINVGTGKTLGVGGTLLLGSGDGTGTVTAPTIRGAARTGTNVVGANLTIDAANGTGTGGSGSLIFRTAPATAGGTTPTTMQTRLVIDGTGRINLGPSSMDWAGAGNVTMGDTSALGFAGPTGHVGTNTYFNGAWRANTNAPSGLYVQASGSHLFYNAAAVPAGTAVALTERLRILDTGAVSFGASGSAYGSAGQVLQSNGNAVPTWVTPTAPTTDNVLSATAGATVGAVGTYAFLRFTTLTTAAPGTTHAGSGLRYTNANGGGSGTLTIGTWRLMGETSAGGTSPTNAASSSLFLRIL